MMAGCCIIVCRKGTAESEEEFKGGLQWKTGRLESRVADSVCWLKRGKSGGGGGGRFGNGKGTKRKRRR